MKLSHRIGIVALVTTACALYIFPWDSFGIKVPDWMHSNPYRLGLDLHGGVELDYKVDLEKIRTQTGNTSANENNAIEGLKTIIDKRANGLGLSDPTIQTARYGQEAHIIVQIPTQKYANLTPEEARAKNQKDIENAKETIGRVVNLEFREAKKEITDADRQERLKLAESALKEIHDDKTPFSTVGVKYQSQYEQVGYANLTGALVPEATFSGVESITKFPYLSRVEKTQGATTIEVGSGGVSKEVPTSRGYAIVEIRSAEGIGTGRTYDYSLLYFDERPSQWTAAKTADGKILNDKYLTRAGVSLSQVGAPEVDLIFNDEGRKIFAELTKRLLNKQIAIFVGGQLVTAPTVQAVITDGRAVINGQRDMQEAQRIANEINTGIVPAPIYLTSERTIDAKIGEKALGEILYAGLIGLVAIVVFLTLYYRVSGLLAGMALIIYAIILVAIVKFFGILLTLASIAGMILSIGLAIDANILIFERMKEALRHGELIERAVQTGFSKSWTAIWDSHITSLTSAIVLFIAGIAMIKGFGLMLGIGIVLSLFTAMWVSRVLIQVVARTRIGQKPRLFVGFHK